MVKEKYYIIYGGSGNAVLTTKENKEFIESLCGCGEIYPFDEQTKKMLIENKVLLADTLYKTDPSIYQDLKEAQQLVEEFNSLILD